jgi:hypothetical protein
MLADSRTGIGDVPKLYRELVSWFPVPERG